jgi:anti-sigma regulatory factor (Ser/Thr protein kinase)
MRHARRFPCQPESLAGARHFVGDLLGDQPHEIVEAAVLMTSELATNSVRHAHSDFELAVHLSHDAIRVEVSDHSQGQPVLRTPTPLDQSGRGLQIVQALAESWGIARSQNGKLVWFTLGLRGEADERESRSTASNKKAPEQGHQLEQSHEADPRPSYSRPTRSMSSRRYVGTAAGVAQL